MSPVTQLPDGRWQAIYLIGDEWHSTTADTEEAAWDEIIDWQILHGRRVA